MIQLHVSGDGDERSRRLCPYPSKLVGLVALAGSGVCFWAGVYEYGVRNFDRTGLTSIYGVLLVSSACVLFVCGLLACLFRSEDYSAFRYAL